MKIDQTLLIIGGIILGIVGLQMGWFHGLLHMNDKPRETPYDFSDRTAMYGAYY